MDAGNLEQIEFLKGPASLLSGEGATGGAVNYVTKQPHTGKIENEAFTSYDSFADFAAASAPAAARRSRAWTTASMSPARRAELHRRHLQQAPEYFGPARLSRQRQLQGLGRGRTQAGQGPVLLGHAAGAGEFSRHRADQRNCLRAVDAILSRPVRLPRPRRRAESGHDRRPDARTTYNVLDNHSGAKELWLRGGFDWDINNSVKLKSQVYGYNGASATGSTARSMRSTTARRRAPALRAKSIASGFRSITARG